MWSRMAITRPWSSTTAIGLSRRCLSCRRLSNGRLDHRPMIGVGDGEHDVAAVHSCLVAFRELDRPLEHANGRSDWTRATSVDSGPTSRRRPPTQRHLPTARVRRAPSSRVWCSPSSPRSSSFETAARWSTARSRSSRSAGTRMHGRSHTRSCHPWPTTHVEQRPSARSSARSSPGSSQSVPPSCQQGPLQRSSSPLSRWSCSSSTTTSWPRHLRPVLADPPARDSGEHFGRHRNRRADRSIRRNAGCDQRCQHLASVGSASGPSAAHGGVSPAAALTRRGVSPTPAMGTASPWPQTIQPSQSPRRNRFLTSLMSRFRRRSPQIRRRQTHATPRTYDGL